MQLETSVVKLEYLDKAAKFQEFWQGKVIFTFAKWCFRVCIYDFNLACVLEDLDMERLKY